MRTSAFDGADDSYVANLEKWAAAGGKGGAVMHVENVEGITYEELRPKKQKTPGAQVGGFPVYPDLVRELSQPGFVSDDVRQARALHVCAVLSAWSYCDAATLSSIMVRMGLAKNRCRRIVVVNDSMFVRSTEEGPSSRARRPRS